MKKLLSYLTISAGLVFSTGTHVNAQYCIPSFPNDCMYGDDINDFVMTGAGINHTGSGCSTAGYGDFTSDLSLTGNLQPTVSYNFSITHNYSDQYVKIWIDFNNDQTFDDISELLFTSAAGSANTTGSIDIPMSVVPINNIRMRVMCGYYDVPVDACFPGNSYGETHDYTVNILPPPACPNPVSLTLDDLTPFDATLSWTEPGTATEYNVEWGVPGFTPGTGTELGSDVIVGATTYNILGLTPATDYEFYVQADCDVDGLSYWAGPFSFTTPCVPVTTLPWSENFDAMPFIGDEIFPNCWVHENNIGGWNTGWSTGDEFTYWGDANPISSPYFLSVSYGADATIWTPEFELVGGETYEFVFNWAGDTYDGWSGEVLVNSAQTSVGATVLGAPFVQVDEPTTLDYNEEIYCFTADSNGTYSFGIHVTEVYYWYYLSVDNVSLRISNPSAGTDAAYDICQTEGLIDLNYLGTITDPAGVWSFTTNPSALVDDTLLNTTILPSGVLQATYAPEGCLAPDVLVTLNIQNPSSAGSDGSLDVCMNQQVDLLGGLSGDVNLGGTWYDPSSNALSSSYFMTGTTPGSYNYQYITSNGVCPEDTSIVTLNILTCDYLELDESALNNIRIYPNPTNGNLFISATQGITDFKVAIMDMNGRTVFSSENNSIINSDVISIDLSDVEDGIYMIRVFSDTEDAIYRIVKN